LNTIVTLEIPKEALLPVINTLRTDGSFKLDVKSSSPVNGKSGIQYSLSVPEFLTIAVGFLPHATKCVELASKLIELWKTLKRDSKTKDLLSPRVVINNRTFIISECRDSKQLAQILQTALSEDLGSLESKA
jgi:hypothetical protein